MLNTIFNLGMLVKDNTNKCKYNIINISNPISAYRFIC